MLFKNALSQSLIISPSLLAEKQAAHWVEAVSALRLDLWLNSVSLPVLLPSLLLTNKWVWGDLFIWCTQQTWVFEPGEPHMLTSINYDLHNSRWHVEIVDCTVHRFYSSSLQGAPLCSRGQSSLQSRTALQNPRHWLDLSESPIKALIGLQEHQEGWDSGYVFFFFCGEINSLF